MNRIYLDWNATAPPLPEVAAAMTTALTETWGNASSVHHEGQVARGIVERARRGVAAAVGAPPQSVVLCGGATEANNQVLRHHASTTAAAHIVCTAVEHPSVAEVVEELGRRGTSIEVWPVDERGRLDLDWLRQRADSVTLVSVMLANNETGNIHPVTQIAGLAAERGFALHVDATQAFGRVPIDAAVLRAQYLTLSFHKCGGPKGIGAIVLEEGCTIDAMLQGGHQERGRRPGTENVPAAAGLLALTEVVRSRLDDWTVDLERKRTLFLDALSHHIDRFEVRGDMESRLPNTLNLAFAGVDGEDLLLGLDLEGVSASSGSACTAGSLEPSPVILAMGFDEEEARQSVRFSFGPATRDDELREAAERVSRVVRRLRG